MPPVAKKSARQESQANPATGQSCRIVVNVTITEHCATVAKISLHKCAAPAGDAVAATNTGGEDLTAPGHYGLKIGGEWRGDEFLGHNDQFARDDLLLIATKMAVSPTDQNLTATGSSGQVLTAVARDELKALSIEISRLRETLDVLKGVGAETCRPFFADGHPVLYVDAQQLSEHVPRSADTLIGWAERGIIPGMFVPGKERHCKGSWLFDLIQVKRTLDRYRRS